MTKRLAVTTPLTVAALVVSALAGTTGPSVGGTPDRVAAKESTYAQPTPGDWTWEKGNYDGLTGGFKIKPGKNGKPPKVAKIHYVVGKESNGYYCPPVGTTVKVKGSFALRKAPKYALNPGSVYSPWSLSKKDAPAVSGEYTFDGIKPAKATVTWGGNSYPAEIALFFDRERPGKPFRSLKGGMVWRVEDPDLPGSCGYAANAEPK